jgi:cytochrome P450
MPNDSTIAAAPTERKSASPIAVDPAIAAVIKNPQAPAGVPKSVVPPASLPGVSGLFYGIRHALRAQRLGVAHSSSVRARYGDIYRGMFVGRPVVFIWDPDEVLKILRNEGGAWSTGMGWDSTIFAELEPNTGNLGALMSLDFDEHRAARKLVQAAFTMKALQGYVDIANRSFERAIPDWLGRGRVDFKPEMRSLLARVAGEIFTGLRDPAQVALLDRSLNDFWRGFFSLSKNPWLSPTFRRARRGFQTLNRMFLELIPERRQKGGDDLFSQLCCAEDKAGLTDEAMVRIFISIMFGAFDTTSAGLTSMGYLLAKHPDWQSRLRDEARRIAPEQLDASRMRELQQHDWVWKETLRLLPVAGFVPRRTFREVEVSGHRLPAGILAFVMAGFIGHHPRWWNEHSKFDPERFSPERAEDKRNGGIHLPFGAGAHACVGMQLANLEMKLFWHKVLTTCRVTLVEEVEPHHEFSPMGCVSGKVPLRFEAVAAGG